MPRFYEGAPRVGGPKPKRKPRKSPSAGLPYARPNAPAKGRIRRPPIDPIFGQIQAIFGPQQSYLQNSISQQQSQANAEALRKQQLYQAYAQWYGSHVPQQIQGIYSQAATEQSGFAKGFSDGMKIAQDQTAGESNKLIANAHGTPGQFIHPNANASDVLYGTGGFFPASTLSTQGAAFGAAAALMPGAIMAEGGRQAEKIRETAAISISKLQGELAKLQAKAVQTGLTLSESRRKERLKLKLEKIKMKIAARKDADMSAYRWASLDLRQKEAILRNRNEAKRIFQAQQRIGLSERSQSFGEWYKQQQLELSGQRVQQGQQRLNRSGGLSSAGSRQLRKTAGEIASDAWNGVPTTQHDADGNPVYGTVHLTYQEAVKEALSQGIPLNIIQGALNVYWAAGRKGVKRGPRGGFYNPGWEQPGQGRPAKSYQGRRGKGSASAGGRVGTAYTAPASGNIIGTPYAGTHNLGNWESDNAVDVAMSIGSPIYAVADGTIGSQFGSLGEDGGRFAGLRLHLVTNGNEFYYAHLSRFAPGIRPGSRVRKGQIIGYSGSANGVAHLHLGMRSGDPRNLYGGGNV